jgi:hypothetical protein
MAKAEAMAPGNYTGLKLEHAASVAAQQDATSERGAGESASAAQEAGRGEKEMADGAQAQQDKATRFREMMDESQSQGFSRGDQGRE